MGHATRGKLCPTGYATEGTSSVLSDDTTEGANSALIGYATEGANSALVGYVTEGGTDYPTPMHLFTRTALIQIPCCQCPLENLGEGGR